MKQQKIIRSQSKEPTVIDERTIDIPSIPDAPSIPVRAVVYVEVKDMNQSQIRDLVTRVSQAYSTARGGVHYVIPVRNGVITSDIVFENEFLDTVKKMCEIVDNTIVLKGGAAEVRVIRESV